MTIEDLQDDALTFAVLLIRKLHKNDNVQEAIASAGLCIEYAKAFDAIVAMEEAEGEVITGT